MPGSGNGKLRPVGHGIGAQRPEAGLVYRMAVEFHTVHPGAVRPHTADKYPARIEQLPVGIRIYRPFQRVNIVSQPESFITDTNLRRKRGSTILHSPPAGADQTVGFILKPLNRLFQVGRIRQSNPLRDT